MTPRFLVVDLDKLEIGCHTDNETLAHLLAKKWSRENSWWNRILTTILRWRLR